MSKKRYVVLTVSTEDGLMAEVSPKAYVNFDDALTVAESKINAVSKRNQSYYHVIRGKLSGDEEDRVIGYEEVQDNGLSYLSNYSEVHEINVE